MNATTHPLAETFLRRLEQAARVLPRHGRTELVAEIRSHFESGLRTGATEAEVRHVIDELGPPEEILAAARPGFIPRCGSTRGENVHSAQ
jgi:uncharacterized membrane protein